MTIRTPAPPRAERGFAMVIALLVLLVISIVAVVLLHSINADTKVVGHSVRLSQALNNAEAGVAEAMARIRNGDVPSNGNPRMVSQIFLVNAGSQPALGTDSVSLYTRQPAGQWFTYSTAARSPDALTVQYKTNSARTAVYRYNPSLTPPIQTTSGQPIFEIRSTGVVGANRRRIVTEVYPKPLNVNVQAALTANFAVTLSGSALVCGYNHRADTPNGKGKNGRLLWNGCLENLLANQWEYSILTPGHLPSVWTPFGLSLLGFGAQFGAIPALTGQTTPFFEGPWAVLGMPREEFYSWVGSPLAAAPSPPRGIYYLDNDAVPQNRSGSFTVTAGDGEGLLYVDGNLTITGAFNFRGLIYVEGNVTVTGDSWTLGAMVIRGTAPIQLGPGTDCTILYSRNAIADNLTRYGSRFGTLSWRETD